jgi:N-acetylmuramoyl-L-alanine amidase
MRNLRLLTAFTFAGALCVMPLATSAWVDQSTAKPTAAKAATTSSHATTGTVKSISSDSLVITRPGHNGKDMTFVINSSTQKEGNPDVGSKVSVRYHQEGASMVATAIMAQGKAPASKKK